MDEAPVNPLATTSPKQAEKPKRDARGRLLKGYTANPYGAPPVKQLTAQQFIEAMFKTYGKEAPEAIFKVAKDLAKDGDVALLCKILDKILPSKTETKTDMTVTHREEFLKMRARAMEILENYKVRQG